MPPVSKTIPRHIVNRLRDAGAVSADAAQPLPDLRPLQAHHLRKLLESGVIHHAGADRYWVNEPQWAEYRRMRRMIGLTIAAIGIGSVALIVWFTHRG
jgi:hypothetical protein